MFHFFVLGTKFPSPHHNLPLPEYQISQNAILKHNSALNKIDISSNDLFQSNKELFADNSLYNKFNLWIPKLALLFCSALMGSHYASTKILSSHIKDPSFVTFLRFVIASIIFIPNILFSKGVAYHDILGGLELGALIGSGYISDSIVLQHTSAGKTAFLSCLGVLLIPILDKCFHANHSSVSLLGLFGPPILCLCGVAILEIDEPTSVLDISQSLPLLIGPLLFAFATWRAETIMQRSRDVNVKVLAGVSVMTSAVVCGIWWILTQFMQLYHNGNNHNIILSTSTNSIITNTLHYITSQMISLYRNIDTKIFVLLMYLSLIVTSLSTYIDQMAMKYVSAKEASIIYSSESIFSALLGWYFLNEKMGINTAIAALLITISCIWSANASSLDDARSGALM